MTGGWAGRREQVGKFFFCILLCRVVHTGYWPVPIAVLCGIAAVAVVLSHAVVLSCGCVGTSPSPRYLTLIPEASAAAQTGAVWREHCRLSRGRGTPNAGSHSDLVGQWKNLLMKGLAEVPEADQKRSPTFTQQRASREGGTPRGHCKVGTYSAMMGLTAISWRIGTQWGRCHIIHGPSPSPATTATS